MLLIINKHIYIIEHKMINGDHAHEAGKHAQDQADIHDGFPASEP